MRNLCARTLAQRKLPVENRLGFHVVALPGVGHMSAAGEDEKEAARVFYVAATRATQRLVMGVGGDDRGNASLGMHLITDSLGASAYPATANIPNQS